MSIPITIHPAMVIWAPEAIAKLRGLEPELAARWDTTAAMAIPITAVTWATCATGDRPMSAAMKWAMAAAAAMELPMLEGWRTRAMAVAPAPAMASMGA